MDKKTLLTIFIFFIIGNQLWNIIWDVLKALFYIIVILTGLNYLNPEISKNIRDTLKSILNLDTNLLKNYTSVISKTVLNLLGSVGLKETKSEEKSKSETKKDDTKNKTK